MLHPCVGNENPPGGNRSSQACEPGRSQVETFTYFAIGVATGLILEFEFGTNWSNYSWFVGDIFCAPLAIEGILAFFMEATFIAVMFYQFVSHVCSLVVIRRMVTEEIREKEHFKDEEHNE